MTDVVIRPLVAGEESLFESMPDPLPQLRQVSYADGIAGGGYRPERVALRLRCRLRFEPSSALTGSG